MTPAYKMRTHVAFAAFIGLLLRVFLVLKLPFTSSGDASFYIELAWNWLKKGVYGFQVNSQLMPVDMRAPGYPAFLAAIFALAGNSSRAVMLAQAVLDLGTCFLIALIAARLAPSHSRRRVALAALWLAALCPFTANYSSVVLTETLVTFLTALAILVLLETNFGAPQSAANEALPAKSVFGPWFLGGIVAGFGTLVRPETPLLLLSAAIVLATKWWRPHDWLKLARACMLMGLGLLLPLVPWAARNWNTLHEVQFLAPRYGQLPGELAPVGLNSWTRTWLWRFGDVYLTLWKVDDEAIPIGDVPPAAFDSPQERARVENLFDRYNDALTLSPEMDREFGEIARERTARHPLRTYLKIPLLRALTLWFTPRVELLPFSGHIYPLPYQWKYERENFLVTLSFILINGIYLALALAGARIARHEPGWVLLIAFLLVRTVFFSWFIETPEPRYVLECFPAVFALAAQVFHEGDQLSSTGSG